MAKTGKEQAKAGRGGKRSTSWEPGESANPRGRPKKGESFSEVIRERFTRPKKQKVADKAIGLAEDGDMTAMKFLRDTTEGRPAQPIVGDDEAPIPITLQLGNGPAKTPKEMTDAELKAAQEQLGDDGDGD